MIIDELIFDRTNKDLEKAQNLVKNNLPFPSDDLRMSWDYRALNRTEGAMEYLQKICFELGYCGNMEIKKDWLYDEITPEQAERYLKNLHTLRNAVALPSDTPIAPTTINGMSINKANDIEKILHDLDYILTRIIANFRFSNDLYCGEDYFS